jgi:molybdopterin-containing oxidoreductase family membrane subunit
METRFEKIDGTSAQYYLALSVLAALAVAGFACTLWVSQQGLWRTGMNNRVPWGVQIVMAIYYIGLSAGSLVISGLYGVFGKVEYKPFARIAVYAAMLLLIAGLLSIATDQGRIDRFFVQPFVHLNPRSLFSINPALYVGYILICMVYLWALLTERSWLAPGLATLALAWAVGVHSGTGAIFGFNARMLYESPLLPASFVVAAMASGTALMIVLIVALFKLTKRHVDDDLVLWLGRFLRACLLVVLYFMVAENAFRLYVVQGREAGLYYLFEGFHSTVFWGGLIFLGCCVPLLILFNRRTGGSVRWVVFASVLVIGGVLCERYVIVLPGLTYSPDLFPGMQVVGLRSQEGITSYSISVVEVFQVLGVLGTIGFLFLWGLKAFRLMPTEARIDRPQANFGRGFSGQAAR